MGNLVAIVGRPNVGKSTFFNRLVGWRHAIVDEIAGVTRDRIYGKSDWNGKEFSVIDTGGWVENSDDIFEEEIRKQVLIAIDEADIITFLVDAQEGITDMDIAVAEILRRSSKPVYLVANKVDNNAIRMQAGEFYSLGLGDPWCISSINGSGTGDLLDDIVKHFTDIDESAEQNEVPRIAVVGRPNVGKSSLINTFIGEERNIVTPLAGTTRDAIDTHYRKFGHDFIIVDTAGLRRKTKVKEDLEFYSVMRSVRAIESSDVCLLLIDATQGIERQDMNIFSLIVRNKKGLVLVVNKWDLVEKNNKTVDEYTKLIKERIAPFNDVPIIFASALTKQRVFKVIEAAMQVYENRKRRISTSELNNFLQETLQIKEPPVYKGKLVKIKYATQLPTKTPQFAFFCNLPQYIKDPYKRFIENRLREKFNLTGVPIQIYFREK
ncbi:ribosome biogenesis GTPase Der [Tenuifilum sp.]|uniref:ribosome biogenesis GTPase Der n=1 Tax=Tenuifilum sp. TaxID=2760880 RepID=UPI001B3F4FF5|nr:ribosome biogenesis GTPase Der [Bacteroidales bacterium]HOK62013.1 ribosome biogenesis GTPase Der [Tenuifilum sp.]HON71276.1 ribosome biogenesis GTPase Der [Tenuifilum sp.]HOU74440.1 ribosome biogenesis GTPase Der [Tenuifilum sp.]HPP91027.1 ribosome biogenesis GTPase Der [Tenuifilum sp.]